VLLKELVDTLKCDLYRYKGANGIKSFAKIYLIKPEFKYIVWMRLTKYIGTKGKIFTPIKVLSLLTLKRYSYKYGINIPYKTDIGKGFFISHPGEITINEFSKVGINCNISQGVTLGQANRGKNKGYPVVGENVYIGPGAKLVGNVHVSNNCCIGANCVVTKDVPENGVSVGIPNKTVSFDGSEGYINYTA
jgi:serine O-acetyltransferase